LSRCGEEEEEEEKVVFMGEKIVVVWRSIGEL